MKFYLNKDSLETIIRSYKMENFDFQFKSLAGNDSKKRCTFYLKGVKCEIDFFFKKDGTINPIPVGDKALDECNLVIDYVLSKGLDANVETSQFVFNLTNESLEILLRLIDHEYSNIITIERNDNFFRFVGYNGDWINLTFYPTKNKAMIQGKALYTYSIIINIIVDFEEVGLEEIILINNRFVNNDISIDIIRTEIEQKLEKSYKYLDEALLKSISGSISMLKSKTICEDYTGHIAGMFKGLEGYLKKILNEKYNIKFDRDGKFSMFYKDKSGLNDIDRNSSISIDAKKELNNLYRIYNSKRNRLLHATIDPSQTKIIENLGEAKELATEILEAIEKSYKIFF